MRAAIYTRFSSDKQCPASRADQAEVCRRYAELRGWTVVRVYDDQAVSGGSRFRSSYQQLLLDAEKKEFDVLVCEALDRLARKLADIADLFDRLTFLGIQLHATAIGPVTPLHIGMPGTMSQLYLADLKEKTWRGQLGRALQGKALGARLTATTSSRRSRRDARPSAGTGGSTRPRPRCSGASSRNMVRG